MAVGIVQRFPRGLLQFLGMVGTGDQPRLLADEVRASLDMLHFYGSTTIQRVGATALAGVTAAGDQLVLTVPAGEHWMMLGATVAVGPAAAADVLRTSFRVQVPPAAGSPSTVGQVQLGQSGELTAVAAGAILSFGFPLPQPFMLAAGSAIVANVDDENIAAPLDWSVFGLVYRFPVLS